MRVNLKWYHSLIPRRLLGISDKKQRRRLLNPYTDDIVDILLDPTFNPFISLIFSSSRSLLPFVFRYGEFYSNRPDLDIIITHRRSISTFFAPLMTSRSSREYSANPISIGVLAEATIGAIHERIFRRLPLARLLKQSPDIIFRSRGPHEILYLIEAKGVQTETRGNVKKNLVDAMNTLLDKGAHLRSSGFTGQFGLFAAITSFDLYPNQITCYQWSSPFY